jgi:hypothetical protein
MVNILISKKIIMKKQLNLLALLCSISLQPGLLHSAARAGVPLLAQKSFGTCVACNKPLTPFAQRNRTSIAHDSTDAAGKLHFIHHYCKQDALFNKKTACPVAECTEQISRNDRTIQYWFKHLSVTNPNRLLLDQLILAGASTTTE